MAGVKRVEIQPDVWINPAFVTVVEKTFDSATYWADMKEFGDLHRFIESNADDLEMVETLTEQIPEHLLKRPVAGNYNKASIRLSCGTEFMLEMTVAEALALLEDIDE